MLTKAGYKKVEERLLDAVYATPLSEGNTIAALVNALAAWEGLQMTLQLGESGIGPFKDVVINND